MQSPLVSFISTAMQKPSRFLYRDFFEIELSQSSKHMMDAFVSKAYTRTEEALVSELKRHPRSGTVGTDSPVQGKINFSICAIDGIKNLTRSLPFFSISVCAYSLDANGTSVPEACVIDFPALGDIYYAERGKGVFLIKNTAANSSIRLKVSNHSNPHMVASSEEFATMVACERRNLGCLSYELALLASGKMDMIITNESSEHFRLIAELFLAESGGKIRSRNPLVLSNGHCSLDVGNTLTS